jgi:uncharacterized membrane protein
MALTFDFIVELVRVFLGMLLLLFIPGFAISLIFYPKVGDIPLVERFVLSGIVSIGSSVGVFLLMDVWLGVETTARNGTIFLIFITVLALIIWKIELIITKKITRRSSQSVLSNAMKLNSSNPVVSKFSSLGGSFSSTIKKITEKSRKKFVRILKIHKPKNEEEMNEIE